MTATTIKNSLALTALLRVAGKAKFVGTISRSNTVVLILRRWIVVQCSLGAQVFVRTRSPLSCAEPWRRGDFLFCRESGVGHSAIHLYAICLAPEIFLADCYLFATARKTRLKISWARADGFVDGGNGWQDRGRIWTPACMGSLALIQGLLMGEDWVHAYLSA